MKKLLFLIPFLVINFQLTAQISRADVLPLFTQLEEKDYKDAHKTALDLLSRFEQDSSYIMGIVRYGFLYSGAALIADGKMDYDELKVHSSKLEGKLIRMAAHPSSADTSRLQNNTNVFYPSKAGTECRTTSTNEAGTSIYFFENFHFDNALEVERLNGKITRCGGVLDKIEFNPNGSKIWIMRLHISNADLQVLQ